MEGDDLDAEMPQLKIGKSAVALIQEDIDRYAELARKASDVELTDRDVLSVGALGNLDDSHFEEAAKKFFSP